MDLRKIREMVTKDMPIDGTELDLESLKIPQLHNKYLNLYSDEKLVAKKLEFDYKALRRLKWEYYTGKLDEDKLEELEWEPFDLKIMKADLDKYLDSDSDLHSLYMKLEYQKEKIDYLENVLKSINGRQWNIRGAIEWRKFINGVGG